MRKASSPPVCPPVEGAATVRKASSPHFCPPVEEGAVYEFIDEKDAVVSLEFLGLIEHKNSNYGFFFEVDKEKPALSSGSVVILEVLSVDSNGQPEEFSLLEDEAIAQEVYASFKKATKNLYNFE